MKNAIFLRSLHLFLNLLIPQPWLAANDEHSLGKYGIGENGIGEHGIGE